MSIDSDLQSKASITEGDRALSLFTNRYRFTRLLAERLHESPSEKILFFHGAGGNGKSLLLKYLQQNICKRLTAEQWQVIKDKPDDELQSVLKNWPATGHLPIPSALLDFTPRSGPQNTDLFYGLLNIRQMLTKSVKGTRYKLKFPLHTYGCFLYLKKTNRIQEVDDLFRFEEMGLVKDFVGLVKSLPEGVGIGVSVLQLLHKYSGQRLTHYKRRFGLDEQLVKKIQSMDAEKELRPLLPKLFAQDLQMAMEKNSKEETPERVVLFFDTHEAFYGADRNRKTNFFRDGWLRRLFRELLDTPEVLILVSGRDVPRWAEADEYEPDTAIKESHICTVAVDSLSEADAELFLQQEKVGITDAAMRRGLICYASEQADAVHPLHLALCVEVVREAEQKGKILTPQDFSEIPEFQKKSRYLIRQLLKYVDEELEDAILALSACRSFDRSLYMVLGKKTGVCGE